MFKAKDKSIDPDVVEVEDIVEDLQNMTITAPGVFKVDEVKGLIQRFRIFYPEDGKPSFLDKKYADRNALFGTFGARCLFGKNAKVNHITQMYYLVVENDHDEDSPIKLVYNTTGKDRFPVGIIKNKEKLTAMPGEFQVEGRMRVHSQKWLDTVLSDINVLNPAFSNITMPRDIYSVGDDEHEENEDDEDSEDDEPSDANNNDIQDEYASTSWQYVQKHFSELVNIMLPKNLPHNWYNMCRQIALLDDIGKYCQRLLSERCGQVVYYLDLDHYIKYPRQIKNRSGTYGKLPAESRLIVVFAILTLPRNSVVKFHEHYYFLISSNSSLGQTEDFQKALRFFYSNGEGPYGFVCMNAGIVDDEEEHEFSRFNSDNKYFNFIN